MAVVLCGIAAYLAQQEAHRTMLLTFAVTCVATVVLVVLSAPLVRPILRDIVWFQAPIYTAAALSLAAAAVAFEDRRRPLWLCAILIPWTVAAIYVWRIPDQLLRADLNYNIYGWDAQRVGTPVYGGNQARYLQAIRQRIPDWRVAPGTNGAAAFRQALDLDRVRRTVGFVLPNQRVPLRKIGVLEPGHSVSSERGAAIAEMPPELRGATVVDLHGLRTKGIRRLRPQTISTHAETIDNFMRERAGSMILLVPRNDLSLFLFQIVPAEREACTMNVTTRSPDGAITRYCGNVEAKYRELAPVGVSEAFLVIQPRWAP
jgi:hypothetical protein